MKTKYVLPLLFGVLFLISTFGASAQQADTGYTGPTFDSTNYPDFEPNYPYVCANQTDTSNVTATLNLAEGTSKADGDLLKFNTTTLIAPKDACVALVIRNLSPDVTHDLVIEEVAGANGITHVDMDVENSTADIGWGPGLNVFFFKTPNADVQFTYFCEQPGHEAAGMKGTLYVGKGPDTSSSSAAPGFEAITALVGIIASVGMVSFYRKRH